MKKLGIAVLLCVLSVGAAFAQPIKSLTPAKKIKIAEEQLAQNNTYNALEWFEKAYDDDPTNVNLLQNIADLHYQLRDFKKAETWYKKLVRKDKAGQFPLARFTYARIIKMNGKYDEAISAFEDFVSVSNDTRYKQLAANEINGAQLGKELTDNPDVKISTIGASINSRFTEASPALASENELYYTTFRTDSIIVVGDEQKPEYFSRLFKSTRDGDSWGKGRPVSGGINTIGSHTGNVALTENGNRMYFSRCVLQGNNLKSCHIYVSNRDGDNWSEPVKVEGINSDTYMSKQPAVATISGRETLFFVSNMAGGQGGWDLYYATSEGDAAFGEPINLGSTVNSVGDDETPFFKNKVLYFSSNGHPGIGGYDVFGAKQIGVSSWSAPEHLGKGINSRVDDMYYTLDRDGYKGFVVSNRPGTTSIKSETCCDDIFAVKLLDVPCDILVTTFDAKDKSALSGATVTITEITSSTNDSQTNDRSNDFEFGLIREKKYRIVATRTGYYEASTEVNTLGVDEPTSLEAKLDLRRIPPPPPPPPPPPVLIALDTIYYNFDKHNIRQPDAVATMEKIISLLKQNPNWTIEVASHTDSKGTNQYNDDLSIKRTSSAIEYMSSKGISAGRLVPRSYGENVPKAPNQRTNGLDNPVGRQYNRRTEFRILDRSTTGMIQKKNR